MPIRRRDQQGQTILLVAISMMALIAFAALAIDIVSLYVARAEVQRAADAAALSGAKVFVTSGYTSNPSAFNTTTLCNGGTGDVEAQAQNTLTLNDVAGTAPGIVWAGTSCTFTNPANPRFTIQVERTALPTFFARIWGPSASRVSATATAEAYNPSGYGGAAGPASIQVGSVKPFLLPNCLPGSGSGPNPNCATAANVYYIDPTTGNVVNPGSLIGSTIYIQLPPNSSSTNLPGQYYFYPIDFPTYPPTPACPSTSAGYVPSSCNGVSTPNWPYYYDNIACSNPTVLSCGQTVGGGTSFPVDTRLHGNTTNWSTLQSRLDQGTQCLIHANSSNNVSGACSAGAFAQDCFTVQGPGEPVLISPGTNNPDRNAAFLNAPYISRSDSVITVPLFDGRNLCLGAGSGVGCNYSAPVVGFLQLGIVQDAPVATGPGSIQAIVLNASGCNSGVSGTPISGGDVSPIPVRLVSPTTGG